MFLNETGNRSLFPEVDPEFGGPLSPPLWQLDTHWAGVLDATRLRWCWGSAVEEAPLSSSVLKARLALWLSTPAADLPFIP